MNEHALIVAVNHQGIIGLNGRIPWTDKGDMKFFQLKTLSHAVIMGRKTYESIGKPLTSRHNIVVSRTLTDVPEGVIVRGSLIEAIGEAMSLGHESIYIIGGEEIYKRALHCSIGFNRVYITEIKSHIQDDVLERATSVAYFPAALLNSGWRLDGEVYLPTPPHSKIKIYNRC